MNAISSLPEGKILFPSGRPERSIPYFTAALEQGADPVSAGLSRGAVYMSLRRYLEADADFTLALATDPDNERALFSRGVAGVAHGAIRRCHSGPDPFVMQES